MSYPYVFTLNSGLVLAFTKLILLSGTVYFWTKRIDGFVGGLIPRQLSGD